MNTNRPAPAPLDNEVAEGPSDARGIWLRASDHTRLRAGLWHANAAKGTVLLLPGRTEYVEKYGRTAQVLAEAGYATLALDWRGQGRSDRALADPMVGHVADFAEYQDDLDTLLAFAQTQGLPQPFHILAHSMGGCIALRGLIRGLPVRSAAFAAPMWGILIAPLLRPIANTLPDLAHAFNFDHRYAPGTGAQTYVTTVAFRGNTLTTDPDMWAYMKRQAEAHPALSLGGPSYGWLRAALKECRALARCASPATPCFCAYGNLERIIDTKPIRARMKNWPNGRLTLVHGAEHEILMERPALRHSFLAEAIGLYAAN